VLAAVIPGQRFPVESTLHPPLWEPEKAALNIIDVANGLYKDTRIQWVMLLGGGAWAAASKPVMPIHAFDLLAMAVCWPLHRCMGGTENPPGATPKVTS
jgi:hypothetical protein